MRTKHSMILNRACEALGDMYHNATLPYMETRNEYESESLQAFIYNQAEFELDHLNGGGAHGGDSTVNFVKSQYKSTKAQNMARKLYIQRRDTEVMKYCPAERITKFGKLYQWGRGGRTVAPNKLVNDRFSGFSVKQDVLEGMSTAELTELIIIVESFNQYVRSWCNSIGQQWNDYKAENDLQAEIESMDRKTKKTRTVTAWE